MLPHSSGCPLGRRWVVSKKGEILECMEIEIWLVPDQGEWRQVCKKKGKEK